jgi:hypothetical protein
MKSVRHHAAAAVAALALVMSAPASAQTAQKWDFGAAEPLRFALHPGAAFPGSDRVYVVQQP